MNNNLLSKLMLAVIISSVSITAWGKKTVVAPVNLRTEYKTNPIGIAADAPRLGWEIAATGRAIVQTAFQVRAAASEKDLKAGKDLLWDSQKIASEQSIHVSYQGATLQSRDKVYWQVKVWTNKGESAWSDAASFEAGLLKPDDWTASWIQADIQEDIKVSSPSPYLRKEFPVKPGIKSARIYASAQGIYQLNLNGQKVSDELFTPGWTSYTKRIQYQVYDITQQLRPGQNAIGIILGDGWYRGYLKWAKNRNSFGEKLTAILQLEITYADGTKETIVTDNSWKSNTGAIRSSDIYNGETYDARLENEGWDKAGFPDAQWHGVIAQAADKKLLVASESVPVKIIQTLKPIQKITTPKNEQVFDFGQNFLGWVQFKLKANKGDKIKLTFAEVLDKDGNFYTANLRSAKATDEYIFKGVGIETYQPYFTFHGFRYLKVENYPGDISLDDLTGKVVYSDVATTGNFSCSDSLINRLQQNIQWSIWDNFLDIPTDCPQRDERLGWTADIQVIAPTACINVDAATFLAKWMKDLAADQLENGSVPHVIPNVKAGEGSAGWADAAVIVPWVLYQTYGDTKILETQYASMKAWVNYLKQDANNFLINKNRHHYGDWLAFATTRSDYPGATTDKDLIATAYFAYSTKLLSQAATVLGKNDDAKAYGQLFKDIKSAFQTEYMTSTGRLSSNTQTAYVLALAFDLIPDNLKKTAAQRLADNVRSFGHITTGFLGTPLICQILSEYGYNDVAYMLLFRKDYPSWLYPVTKGATTIWERWDGIKTDGSFQTTGMNSFNHYAYGAIGYWLYSRVTGVRQELGSTGYKKIIIEPTIDKKLSFAQFDFHSVYGKIASHWEIKDNRFHLKAVIPPNTTAKIYIPARDANDITESGKPLSSASEIKVSAPVNGKILLEVGSGEYAFSAPL